MLKESKVDQQQQTQTVIDANAVTFQVLKTKKRSRKLPKFGKFDYSEENVQHRLDWVAEKTGKELPFLKKNFVPTASWKGNIENLIGVAQIPIGIVGPVKINGDYANGEFFVPMATTEGAIITTYHIGARLALESGGITTTARDHGAHITPMFSVENIDEANFLIKWVKENFSSIKNCAESTTNHGKLVSINSKYFDRKVLLQFNYTTGDAQGLNMINVATEKACYFIRDNTHHEFNVRSNYSGVKKISHHNATPNFGKEVYSEAVISKKTLQKMGTTPEKIYSTWHSGLSINTKSNILGINCQIANAITAIFIACGQDVADISSSHVGYTSFDVTSDGDLHIETYIPSLCIGTVGGGTGKGTQKECLDILGCSGKGKVLKFAEIISAAALCGELTTICAITTGSFVSAHDKLGRNRPT